MADHVPKGECGNAACLSDPCCPCNQEQSYSNHNEPFGSDCRRDQGHHPQIDDPENKEDRRKASAAGSALEAETQPLSPSRGSIRRPTYARVRTARATGKVMRFPHAELQRAGEHDDHTHSHGNDSRQRGLLHLDLGKRRTEREYDNSKQGPDSKVSGAHQRRQPAQACFA